MDVALLAAPPTAAFKGTMCDRVNKFGFFFFFSIFGFEEMVC